jgi:hypothetical protein
MTESNSAAESQLTAEQIYEASDRFLNHFGVEIDPTENPGSFKAALQQLDPRYTGGLDLVRWQLEADQTEWGDATIGIIMQTAESMRMLAPETQLQGDSEVVVVLGGARQANLDRTRYATEGISSGRASTKQIIVAGSNRALPDGERENAANYAPGALTEFDLCVGAAAIIAKGSLGLTLGVNLTADPHAGTPAVIETVLTDLQNRGALPEGSRIAAVTTQIYQPATTLDLARVARRFGASETFTAGNPSDPKIVAKRTPATYLSEVLRTLRAAANDFEASNQPETPEQVRARVARIKNELGSIVTRESALQASLREIDRAHPELSRTTEEADGSITVEEVSGVKWLRKSGASNMWYDGPNDMVGFEGE